MPCIKFIVGCLLWLVALCATAETPVATINNLDEPFDLSPYIEYIEDPNHEFTFDKIRDKNFEHLWQRSTERYFIGKNINSRYWLRVSFTINNSGANKNVIIIQKQAINIGVFKAQLPTVDDVLNERIVDAGKFVNNKARDFDSLNYAFRLHTTKGIPTTLYFSVSNKNSGLRAVLPIYLASETTFKKSDDFNKLLLAAFYGVMASLWIYNFCLFITLRQQMIASYLVFLGGCIYTCSSSDGVQLVLISNWYSFAVNTLGNDIGILTSAAYIHFVYKALNDLDILPKFRNLYRLIILMAPLFIFLSVLDLVGIFVSVWLTQLYGIVVIPTTFIVILIAVYRRVPTSGYLLLAEMMTVAGGITYMLTLQGLVPINKFTYWSLHWGFSTEALLLSLLFAARTQYAVKDKALAEIANKAKSQFFASMSHELRTPLTAILGYSEVALSRDADLEQKQNSLETINRSGQHLLQLINDILDLSKIEAQKLEVESLDVKVIDILHDVHDYFSILAEKKRISFNIRYQFPLPETITSDPTRLKQTIINICGNAVKFTEAGGVTLHVACDNEKQIMQFAIQDTGIGLKPDQVNKLFSAFTQADTATTRNFGGTGLGLHLSKQIAQKLGGDITVESEFGKGSTFTITVATGLLNNVTWLESLPAQVNHSHQAITIPQFAGHILYAEDNPQNQELVSTFVSQTGATIDVVGNGQKALALAQAKQFDLIFTDIRMPTLDGVEFTRTLLTVKPHLPIVAITAAATEHELEEFIAAGFKRILRKPIDRKMLYEVMAEYLPVRNANGTKESEEKSKPLRVLLAEDNIENQALIKIYLKRAGTATIIANDGVEALQIVGREEIDLVLMDMQMPHMDGLTAVRYLRGKGFDKPIYALTANETAEAIQACIDAGCDGHLSKPLDTAQLNELITRIKG